MPVLFSSSIKDGTNPSTADALETRAASRRLHLDNYSPCEPICIPISVVTRADTMSATPDISAILAALGSSGNSSFDGE